MSTEIEYSTDCHHVLRVAAAIGRTFALHDVADLLHQPVAALLPVMDEALALGAITAHGNDFAFCDDDIWREIVEGIPQPVLHSLRVARRHPAPQPDGWDGLSMIEQEIAELVAQGMTNQQVSKQVYLSHHTVNYHLRQIFRQLNVRSRVELARLLPRSRRGETD
ncbi:DNA-binding NarL/FixJ family response regulator [Allocatelliglobosispora scoriae]|uniref:DNA-binding NarL/FixJ family response regulator n=1 Tax=Allocatelliglobosispora scoriae TaxID=643052 RepID=A0A841C1K7_9ACTN|nr:helix-turn-helix transcriptional regulator [Allocatelliglobosispora scoriae]MBB5873638.1 DNA-binding NarL/FixJ family response regulator [Allocatelliglobosispora scoriae]